MKTPSLLLSAVLLAVGSSGAATKPNIIVILGDDLGASRDGTGYRDVTGSTDPEVNAARRRFATILATMPDPKPRAEPRD